MDVRITFKIVLSLQEETEKLLEDLHVYHENYVSILRCLHVFTSSLPKYPLGKQVIYCFMWVLLDFVVIVVGLVWGFFASKYDI